MGVSGCGKSTLASELASSLSWQFVEADDFHSEAAKRQMARGIGLNDEQRMPWLESVKAHCQAQIVNGHNLVLACSALKRQYRSLLRQASADAWFVWIHVTQDKIAQRLKHRSHHFATESLLNSQFDALEAPQNETRCIKVDGELSSAELLQLTLERLTNEDI